MANPIDIADSTELDGDVWEIPSTFSWIDEMLEELDADLARFSPLGFIKSLIRSR